MFAAMIFRKDPFFKGNDNYDQLVKITRVLGTEELEAYLKKYKIVLDQQYDTLISRCSRKPWQKFITSSNKHLCTQEALDFLSSMLIYDHALRITPKDALNHPYFLPIKKQLSQEINLSLIHISEPTRQAEISYAVFCLKKKKNK
eukprot:TRINITY_DN10666_c0_g1_i1.p2 TRINITY_DN10666_c0_g1~~TRINITY_DN10666_c0_g1_i1.p2  ORF type:complete len:145 (-),score=28.91 TRINITY_DN10666_c0_g1_i1:18-452(-)